MTVTELWDAVVRRADAEGLVDVALRRTTRRSAPLVVAATAGAS